MSKTPTSPAPGGPLRILQLVTVRWYNACADYAITLSESLAERGHRVVVGGFPGSPPIEEARRRGLSVLEAFDFRPGRGNLLTTVPRFRRYLKGSRFDVINAHRAEDHVHAALALGFRPFAPLIRTRGDVRPPQRHLFNRYLYERMTSVHVLAADFMRLRFYQGFRIPADRLVTIRPGIDVASWRAGAPTRWGARDMLDIPRTARVIGIIGRLAETKGHLVALDAFSRIARRFPEARLVISGDPEAITPALLKERAQHLGIERSVQILPRLPDVRMVMAALDIALIGSIGSEAISRVALEYQALGLPVVGTDVNSIPEMVVHGRTGLIVPPNDPAAMARALERFLAEPTLAARLGEAGPEQVTGRYDRRAMVDQTESLYLRLQRAEGSRLN